MWSCARGRERGCLMDLAVINEQGQTSASMRPMRLSARLQRGAGASGGDRLQQRSGNRAQKTRAEVTASTHAVAPWTGRARSGRVHRARSGAGWCDLSEQADENFTQKVNRKMYRAGLATILSQLAREGNSRLSRAWGRVAEDQEPGRQAESHGLCRQGHDHCDSVDDTCGCRRAICVTLCG